MSLQVLKIAFPFRVFYTVTDNKVQLKRKGDIRKFVRDKVTKSKKYKKPKQVKSSKS